MDQSNTVRTFIEVLGLDKLDSVSKAFLKIRLEGQSLSREALQSPLEGLQAQVGTQAKEIRKNIHDALTPGLKEGEKDVFSPFTESLARSTEEMMRMGEGATQVSSGGLENMLAKIQVLDKDYDTSNDKVNKLVESYKNFGKGVMQAHDRMSGATEKITNEQRRLADSGRSVTGMMAGMEKRSNESWLSLNKLSAAGAGALMGFQTLNGSIMGMAFGLIFLKFAMVPIAMTTFALSIAIGVLVKAMTNMINVIKKSVSAFSDYETALISLVGRLGDFKAASGAYAYAAAAVRRYGFDFQKVMGGINELIKSALPHTKELLIAQNNLAAVMGGDGTKAARLLTSAIGLGNGNLEAMREIFPTITKAQAEAFNQMSRYRREVELAAMVNKKLAGAADAYARTMKAAVNRLKGAFQELYKTLGQRMVQEVITPAINKLADFIWSLVDLSKNLVRSAGFVKEWNRFLAAGKEAMEILGLRTDETSAKLGRLFVRAVLLDIRIATLAIIAFNHMAAAIKQVGEAIRWGLPFWKVLWGAIRIAAGLVKEFINIVKDLKGSIFDLGDAFQAALERAGILALTNLVKTLRNTAPKVLGILEEIFGKGGAKAATELTESMAEKVGGRGGENPLVLMFKSMVEKGREGEDVLVRMFKSIAEKASGKEGENILVRTFRGKFSRVLISLRSIYRRFGRTWAGYVVDDTWRTLTGRMTADIWWNNLKFQLARGFGSKLLRPLRAIYKRATNSYTADIARDFWDVFSGRMVRKHSFRNLMIAFYRGFRLIFDGLSAAVRTVQRIFMAPFRAVRAAGEGVTRIGRSFSHLGVLLSRVQKIIAAKASGIGGSMTGLRRAFNRLGALLTRERIERSVARLGEVFHGFGAILSRIRIGERVAGVRGAFSSLGELLSQVRIGRSVSKIEGALNRLGGSVAKIGGGIGESVMKVGRPFSRLGALFSRAQSVLEAKAKSILEMDAIKNFGKNFSEYLLGKAERNLGATGKIIRVFTTPFRLMADIIKLNIRGLVKLIGGPLGVVAIVASFFGELLAQWGIQQLPVADKIKKILSRSLTRAITGGFIGAAFGGFGAPIGFLLGAVEGAVEELFGLDLEKTIVDRIKGIFKGSWEDALDLLGPILVGAAAGSIVPGVGTAVGIVAGAIVGLFGSALMEKFDLSMAPVVKHIGETIQDLFKKVKGPEITAIAWDKLTAGLDKAGEKLINWYTRLSEVDWKEVWETFKADPKGFTMDVLSEQLDKLNTKIKSLTGIDLGSIFEKIANASQRVGQALEPVGEVFTRVFNKLKGIKLDDLINIWDRIVAGVTKAKDIIMSVVGAIADEFSYIPDTVAPLAGEFVETVVSLFNQLKTVVVPLATEFVKTVVAIWHGLLPAIKVILFVVGAIVYIAFKSIQFTVNFWTKVIEKIWKKWGKNILNIVEGVFEFLGPFLLGTLRIVAGIVQIGLNIIVGIIRIVMALIRGDWSGAWDALKDMLGGIWEGIKKVVSGGLMAMGAVLKLGWVLIKNITQMAWALIKAIVVTAFMEVFGWLSGIAGWIVKLMKTLWSDVKGAWEKVSGFFTDTIPGWWSGIKDKIQDLLDKVPSLEDAWNLVKTAWEKVSDFFTSTVPGWFGDMWTAIKSWWTDTIEPGIEGAWGFVEDAWSAIKTFFTDTVPGWFGDMWDAIDVWWTDTIEPGIKGAWGFVEDGWSGAKTFFTDTVPGWIGTMWDVIKAWWTDTIEPKLTAIWGFLTGGDGVWSTLDTFLTDTVPGWIGTMWTTMKAWWTDTIEPGIEDIWGFVTGEAGAWSGTKTFFTETVPGWVGTMWSTMKAWWTDTIEPGIESIWGFLTGDTGVWSGTKTFFTETVPGWIGTMWTTMKAWWTDTIEPKLGAVWDFVTGEAEGVWSGTKTFFTTTVPGWIDTMWTTMNTAWTDTIEPGIGAVWGFLTGDDGAWSSLDTFFTDTVPGWFGSILTKIQDAFTTDFVPWLTDFPGKVKDAIGTADTVKEKLEDVGKWLMEGVKNGMIWFLDTDIGAWIGDVATGMFNHIKSALPSIEAIHAVLSGAGSHVIEGLKSGMVWFLNTNIGAWVGNITTGMFSRIKNALPSVPDIQGTLAAAGSHVMKGFKAGMIWFWNSPVEGVAHFLKSLRGKTVDAIKSAAGVVVKPLKWLYSTGKDIFQGLWDGMTFIWGKIEDWLGGLSSLVPGWLKNLFGFGGGGPTGGGGGPTGGGGCGCGYCTACASGGIVTRPTHILAGEAGPEAIIPLNRMSRAGTGDIHIHIHDSVVANEAAMEDLASKISRKIGGSVSRRLVFDVR